MFNRSIHQESNTPATGTRWLSMCLGLAGIVYLSCEFAFNASLIDAVAARNPAGLENVARVLAGSGLGLMLVRFRHWNNLLWIITLFLCGLVAGYFAQKAVLHVAMSTVTHNEQTNAPDVLILEEAMLSNLISLDGLNPSISNSHPGYTTFIAMLGYTAWNRPAYMQTIHQQRDKLLHQLAVAAMLSKLDSEYAQYQELMARARTEYAGIMNNYNSEMRRIDTSAGEYSGLLQWFLVHRNRCRSDACRADYDKLYNKRVVKAFGRPIPWQIFCDRLPDRTEFLYQSGQVTQATVGGGYDCSGVNPALISDRLHAVLAKDAGTLPNNFKAFLQMPAVQERIIQQYPLAARLDIEPGWSRQDFEQHVYQALGNNLVKVPTLTAANQYQAAEAVLIPPIAITFSLVFTLLNFAGYLADGVTRITHAARWQVWIGVAVIVVLIGLVAPANNIVHGVSGFGVDWIVQYESLIYPIGEALHAVI